MNLAGQPQPTLPGFCQLPLKILPGRMQYPAISRALNTLFAQALAEGELDFLENKKINIEIEDAALCFCVYLEQTALRVSSHSMRPDLSISGNAYAFLVLSTRKEDADTLFFRRQLKSEGDTELGLFVKNFLDGLEPQSLPAHHFLDQCMQNAIRVADHVPVIHARLPAPLRRIIGVA